MTAACTHAGAIELHDGVRVCPACELVFEDGGPVEVLPAAPRLRRATGPTVRIAVMTMADLVERRG